MGASQPPIPPRPPPNHPAAPSPHATQILPLPPPINSTTALPCPTSPPPPHRPAAPPEPPRPPLPTQPRAVVAVQRLQTAFALLHEVLHHLIQRGAVMLQGEVMGSSPPLPPPSLPPQPWAPPQLPQPHSRGSRPHSALPLSPRSFASQSLGVPSHKSLLFGSRPLGVPIPQLRAIDAPIPGLPAPWGSRPPPRFPTPLLPAVGPPFPMGGSQSLGEIPTGGVPIPDPQPGAGGGFGGGRLWVGPTALTGASTSTRNPSPAPTTL